MGVLISKRFISVHSARRRDYSLQVPCSHFDPDIVHTVRKMRFHELNMHQLLLRPFLRLVVTSSFHSDMENGIMPNHLVVQDSFTFA